MAKSTNSLSHTKWLCKYHIVIVPKYRRKIIYNQYRKDLQEIIRTLCKYKGVEIIEGHMMPDHIAPAVPLFRSISPVKILSRGVVPSFAIQVESKSNIDIFTAAEVPVIFSLLTVLNITFE